MKMPNSCLAIFFSTMWMATAVGQVPKQSGSVPFDTGPWIEDFHQLLHEMASHYANLDWAMEERHMNLPKLRKQTESALQRAQSEQEARQIIDRFTEAFGDGHLEVAWPKPQAQEVASAHNASLCDRLGYRVAGKISVDFTALPTFVPLASAGEDLFPSGLLKIGTRKTLGILRIGIFSDKGYPAMCQKAVQQLGMADAATCDAECATKIEIRTANLLTAALISRVKEVRAAGATALLIDITHNGGGSDWVEIPPRVLSSKPLHDPKLAFIKNAHWTVQLEEELNDIKTDLNGGKEPSHVLRRAVVSLQRAVTATKESCNREEVWTTGQVHCSLLVSDLVYASGVLDYAPPGSFAGWVSRTALFHPTGYAYLEGQAGLPLYVLVDSGTWSAAEYFAALLQDNHAATVIGEVTGGAGCGYTNGGIPAQLKNSKADVKMPDCVRFRADGSNEVSGITPDILVPWTHRDSAFQRVEKLRKVLQTLR